MRGAWRRTRPRTAALGAALTLTAAVVGVQAWHAATAPDPIPEMPLARMQALSAKGDVTRAWIDKSSASIVVETRDGTRSSVAAAPLDWWLQMQVYQDLSRRGADVAVGPPPFRTGREGAFAAFGPALDFLASFLPVLLWMILAATTMMFALPMLRQSRSWKVERPSVPVGFKDIAGHDDARAELEEIRAFVSDPSAFRRVGARAPKGVLLVGPPGTGKTLLAKAVACESGASMIAVSGSDFAGMFVGTGRARIRSLFADARRSTPCVIFIDEIDGVGRKRGGGSSAVSREFDATLNQLLTEMDGFASGDGVVVIGATNRVEDLDAALVRPGRFDRHVHVGLPDVVGREAILTVHAARVALAPGVDLRVVARGTSGFSGADLANLVNEAAILAARAGLGAVGSGHFEEARDKAIMGLRRRPGFLDEDDRTLVAYHEAGHALAATLQEECDPVHQATILPRGRSLGLVTTLPLKDAIGTPFDKLEADIAVAMSGRAAEMLVFGEAKVTTGAASDIEYATDLARRMVAEWGMHPAVGRIRVRERSDGSLPEAAETAVREIVERGLARALAVLDGDIPALHRLAAALLEKETMDGDEVREVVGRRGSEDAAAA